MESDNRPTTADKFTQTPRRFRTKSGAIRSPFVYVNVSRKSASSQQPQSPRSKATQVSPDRSTKSDAVPDMDQDVTPACIGEFVSSRSTQTTPAARMTSDASTQTDVTGSVMMDQAIPTTSSVKAPSVKSTQTTSVLPMPSEASTQTDAPPATSSESVQTSPSADDTVCAHAAPQKPEVTLRDAFGYAFSMAADIKTAQQMFRDACADHVYPVNSYKREEFISLLKNKLGYRARFASKEFFQVFMNVAAFVHQYVDPGLDYEIAATFAQAQMGPKWLFTSWLAPRMHLSSTMGCTLLPLPPANTRILTDDLPEPGTYVETDCMRKCAEYNARFIKAAGHCVDPRKDRNITTDVISGSKSRRSDTGANCFL